MNKQRLTRFINKYYLNGTVNSIVLISKSNSKQLYARFISSDKSLLGELMMDKWDFEDSDIGIYNTEQLIKLLSVVDEDITLSLTKVTLSNAPGASSFLYNDLATSRSGEIITSIGMFDLLYNLLHFPSKNSCDLILAIFLEISNKELAI